MTDNASNVAPVLILNQKDALIIGMSRVFVQIELSKFLRVEASLANKLCVA